MAVYIERYEKPKSCDMCVFDEGSWLTEDGIERRCYLLEEPYPFIADLEPPPAQCPIIATSEEIKEEILKEKDLNAFKPNEYLNEEEYKKWREVIETEDEKLRRHYED